MRLLFPLFAFLLSSLMAGSSFAANNNPLMRTCRLEQGLFWIVYSEGQELPLCFFGSAAIGAEALFGFKTGTGNYLSVRVYKENSGATCEQLGATTVSGQDSKKVSYEVCQFRDGSLIEKQTLLRGRGAAANSGLDQSLSSVY